MTVLDPGQRFGRLTVLRFSHYRHAPCGRRLSYYVCVCDCGTKRAFPNPHHANGPRSCDCQRNDTLSATKTTHGMSGSPTYVCWSAMIRRCAKKTEQGYDRYGGRGISVCKRWLASFVSFLADMGLRPSARHSIDRKNTDGNYTPDNCRWSLPKEQSRNRRSNRMIEVDGESRTIAEWAERSNMKAMTLWKRIVQRGWEPIRAMSEPVRKIRGQNC